jgi:2',3'-cyclic-nucleotide 2'-phosphodiesterase (5'-nucleotidase family)
MKTLCNSLILLFIFSCFWSCKDKLEVQKVSGENIEINDSISDYAAINEFIEPYKSSIEDEMDKPLSYTPKAMFKSDTPYNTAIGNMMADAVYELANPVFFNRIKDSIDGVLLNYGGIRAGISKGVITTETAYNIMPFENMVVVAKLKGTQINEMFQYLSKSKKAQPISNISVAVDKDWNLKEYSIGNKEIEASKYYYIATSDYLANGGDNMDFFQKADTVYQTDYKLRNLFIDYFKKHDTINAKADNRFQKLSYE